MTVSATTVFDQIADFMASMNPREVVAFRANETHQNRLDFLLDKQKISGLTEAERRELENFLIINRIVGLAKARAMKLVSNSTKLTA